MSRILVIEGDPELRREYGRALARAGDTVRTVSGAHEAVAAFAAERPDLVVLDAEGPAGDGLRCVERLFAVDRTVPIILNSTCRSYANDPLGWAVDAYLFKSPDTDELKATVRNLLSKPRPARMGGAS